jgi:hypothetical protein
MAARASVAAGEGRPTLHMERREISLSRCPRVEVALRSRPAFQQALEAQMQTPWLPEENVVGTPELDFPHL